MIAMMLPRRPSPVDSRLRGNDGGVRENDGCVASEWRGSPLSFRRVARNLKSYWQLWGFEILHSAALRSE